MSIADVAGSVVVLCVAVIYVCLGVIIFVDDYDTRSWVTKVAYFAGGVCVLAMAFLLNLRGH